MNILIVLSSRMIVADYKDRNLVAGILKESFQENKSVNYVIKQDGKRLQRLQKLMEYSFNVCLESGKVFLSDDKKACALILPPGKQRVTLKSIFRDIRFVVFCAGIFNTKKVLNRESRVKKIRPAGNIYYLWFLGVENAEQGKGLGTKLLHELIQAIQKPVILETSSTRSIPFYTKNGFVIYNTLYFGYELYFLKHDSAF